jgi:hypothetical protein
MRRSAAIALALVAVVASAAADAKPGARARLTTTLPLEATAGTIVDVGWHAEFPGNNGGRPLAARGMFVRLLSRTGSSATTGLATRGARSQGRYAADVMVPEGGIGGIRIGVRTTSGFLPVDNDPFRSRGGVRCDVTALRETLGAFVQAYNGGDLRGLDRLFSRDRFVWFSAGGPVRSDRRTLVSFLMHRHHLADTLRSVTYRFNGYERARDLGHFELHAERRTLDRQDGEWFEMTGKGALDCAKPPVTFAVLALGGG